MINLSKKYSTVIPKNIDKTKLVVSSIFLVEGSEIATVIGEYFQNIDRINLDSRYYLVFHN